MKKRILLSLMATILLSVSAGLGNQFVYAADSPITVYVTPPISDEKILPNTPIDSSYISQQISIVAAPGEYEPASFVIKANTDINSVQVQSSELMGAGYSIPSGNVDIRVVKCWYQAGEPIEAWRGWEETLTPELLLKDDSLVRVENGHNYLKLTNGDYLWISDPTKVTDEGQARTIDQIPVQDSATLQPTSIPSGTNKQFWITINVPDATPAGIYTGQIQINADGANVTIQLDLTVLPIELQEPYLIYSMYYLGKLYVDWPEGSISCSFKSEEQLTKELENILNHGITNPAMHQGYYQPDSDFRKYLTIRNELGMGNQPLYYLSLGPAGYQPVDKVQEVIELAQSYGVTDVYFYGVDEAAGQELLDQRSSWQAIRAAGGKMFAACYGNAFDLVGDLLDLAVFHGPPSSQEAAKWHSEGQQIVCFSNPQGGVEKPKTYRQNFGLLLWQEDYNGAMDFAYQYSMGNIWNDFDHEYFRDHVFAYPTINGVIDTIEWEGFREGVDDIRYLTTLLNTIEIAKTAGEDTSAAEAWLANLKSSDLTTQDLNDVRSDMINYILSLQNIQNVIPAWDVNSDNQTNVLDMILVGQHLGERGIPGWRREDVNNDGVINVLDMAIVGQHWTEE
ncbi:MAG: hypothetical protein JSV32_01650 [Dehalococcoidia bacterium]|nr:MAG: hypothetical protein JSV32_01650 [Dehalococcoidia bacterium]